jgi:hypothetical protein
MLAFLLPCNLFADDLEYKIKAGYSQEYNDNLYSYAESRMADWASVLSSQIMLSSDTDRLKMRVSGDLSGTFYNKYHDLNKADWDVNNNVIWLADEKTRCTSSLAVGKNSNIDRYLSETGTLLGTREQRTLKWNGAVSHDLFERLSVDTGAEYNYQALETADGNKTGNTLNSEGFSTGLTFQADERTALNLFLGYGNYDYHTSTVNQVYTGLGLSRSIDEKLSFSISAGTRHTEFTYNSLVGIDFLSNPAVYIFKEKTNRDWGFIGNAGLNYRLDDGFFKLTIDESLKPSTGYGQSVSLTSVDMFYSKRLDEKFTCRISGLYRYSRSDDPALTGSLRTKTWQVSPGLDYLLRDDLILKGTYSHTEYREESGTITTNVFRILCDYTF